MQQSKKSKKLTFFEFKKNVKYVFSNTDGAHSYWKQGALGAAGYACMGWSWAAACGAYRGRGHIVAAARLQFVNDTTNYINVCQRTANAVSGN